MPAKNTHNFEKSFVFQFEWKKYQFIVEFRIKINWVIKFIKRLLREVFIDF